MALNNFNTLLRELDNIPLHPINLTNTVKGYKEKISQLPRKIAPYVKRYGAAVPFAAGVALYVSGLAHIKYYPEDLTGVWTTLAGTLMMAGSTFAAILYEKYEKYEKVKKMSPKTFREFAELALLYNRQRREREEAESLTKKEGK